jgi:hypothetical protein
MPKPQLEGTLIFSGSGWFPAFRGLEIFNTFYNCQYMHHDLNFFKLVPNQLAFSAHTERNVRTIYVSFRNSFQLPGLVIFRLWQVKCVKKWTCVKKFPPLGGFRHWTLTHSLKRNFSFLANESTRFRFWQVLLYLHKIYPFFWKIK